MASVNKGKNDEPSEKTRGNYRFGTAKGSRAKQMAAARAHRRSQAAFEEVLCRDFREALPSPVPSARSRSLTAEPAVSETTHASCSETKIEAMKSTVDGSSEGTGMVLKC